MLDIERELRLRRFLDTQESQLGGARDVEGVLRSALRGARQYFAAGSGCWAELVPDGRTARVTFETPPKGDWDLELLARFLRNERPSPRERIALAPIRRRGRLGWRVLALTREEPFSAAERFELSRITRALSDRVAHVDRDRIAEVRDRIDRKILAELRPKDLFYQILHGLRTLTGYDHSAALLIAEGGSDTLALVAEQIAWRKGKSRRIGLRLALEPEFAKTFRGGGVYGFEHTGDGWRAWADTPGPGLALLLDYNRADDPKGKERYEGAMICAPLITQHGLIGLLKVASRHASGLSPYEAGLVQRFLPHASVAIRNSRRAETLESKILEAERKTAMATLARSVAHDVNNALGSVVPLVQQIRSDLEVGTVEPQALATDIEQIESSLQVCRRIFGGMLQFAKGTSGQSGEADLDRAIAGTLSILKDRMKRWGIALHLDVPRGTAPIRCRQSDLEQVFFNLLSNACDAMPGGGTLTIGVASSGRGWVEATIEDTGVGIPVDDLHKIREPFFTTKTDGNGLGLTICRSILWEIGGKMKIASDDRDGTRVRLTLPLAAVRGNS